MARSATGAHAVGAGDRDRDRDRSADHDGRRGFTPAQWYCLLAGAALLLAGIAGFFVDSNFDTGGSSDGDVGGNGDGMLQGDGLLGFEVNGWHNVVHLLSGLFLLAMFRKAKTARLAALAFGVIYGIVTIIGLIDGNDVLGLIPVNAADNVLHIALSLLGLVAGLISRGHDHDDDRVAVAGRGTPRRAERVVQTREVDDRVRDRSVGDGRVGGDRLRPEEHVDGDVADRRGEVVDRKVERGRTVDPEVDRDPRSELGDRDPRSDPGDRR